MADPFSLWDALKLTAGTLVGMAVWLFKRNINKIDAIEAKLAQVVTYKHLDDKLEAIKKEISAENRACKAEVVSSVRHEIYKALHDTLDLRKEHFGKLKHGFVGYIDDGDDDNKGDA